MLQSCSARWAVTQKGYGTLSTSFFLKNIALTEVCLSLTSILSASAPQYYQNELFQGFKTWASKFSTPSGPQCEVVASAFLILPGAAGHDPAGPPLPLCVETKVVS